MIAGVTYRHARGTHHKNVENQIAAHKGSQKTFDEVAFRAGWAEAEKTQETLVVLARIVDQINQESERRHDLHSL